MCRNIKGVGLYLALALPLQVNHTHVHNGPQISEGLHHSHIWALVVAVYIELQRKTEPLLRLKGESLEENLHSICHFNRLFIWITKILFFFF